MSEQYKKNLQMETDILRKVRHENIIQMKEIFETDEYLFLVMELVTGGELFDKIVEKVMKNRERKGISYLFFFIGMLHRKRSSNSR